MDNQNLQQLQKLAKIFNTDNVVTSQQVEQVLKGIMAIMASFRQENIKLTEENKEVCLALLEKVKENYNETVADISAKEDKVLSTMDSKASIMEATFNSKIAEANALIEAIKSIEVRDGKDADEDIIVERVLAEIKLPEYKEVMLDDGEQIVEKINALPLNEEFKIDAKHIKNLPPSKITGGTVSKAIYQLSDVVLTNLQNNEVIKWDAANNVWINGVGGGGGTPGGSDTQLQWNDDGSFGGITGATTDGTSVTYATDGLKVNNILGATSAGILLESNSGTDIALLGAGGGAGATFYGGVNLDTLTEGSIPFIGASGLISEDNDYLSWNDSIKTLKIGSGTTTFSDGYGVIDVVEANGNSFYVPFTGQNTSSGTTASTDLILGNDSATDTTNFLNLGISSSNNADPAFTAFGAGSGYLFNQSGELAIGTASAQPIKFFTGGTLAAHIQMIFTASGLLGIGELNPTANVHIKNTATATDNLLLVGSAGQTADHFKIQNSSGVNLFKVGNNGFIDIAAGNTTYINFYRQTEDPNPARMEFYKARGNFGATSVDVNAGDLTGAYFYNGYLNGAYARMGQFRYGVESITGSSPNKVSKSRFEFLLGQGGGTGTKVFASLNEEGMLFEYNHAYTTKIGAMLQLTQATTGWGTVSTTSGGSTVTGSGTWFLNIFKVGDTITINGVTRTISAIASDTSLTITGTWTATNTAQAYSLVGGSVFTAKGNGNVGFGTTNPQSKIDIVEGAARSYAADAGNPHGFVAYSGDGMAVALATGNSNSNFLFDDTGGFSIQARPRASVLTGTGLGSAIKFRIYSTGLVDIGNNPSATNARLGVTSGATTEVVTIIRGASSQTGDLTQWQSSGGTVLSVVNSAGNVGIGTASPNSTTHINGSFATAYVAKTATYTATAADYTIDCTANTFTVTLPTAVGITGRIYVIKNTGTGVITVDGNSTETIDGQLTQTLNQWNTLKIQSNGSSGWIII
jgi:hypothetical protein